MSAFNADEFRCCGHLLLYSSEYLAGQQKDHFLSLQPQSRHDAFADQLDRVRRIVVQPERKT
jgi:hypothetical protein